MLQSVRRAQLLTVLMLLLSGLLQPLSAARGLACAQVRPAARTPVHVHPTALRDAPVVGSDVHPSSLTQAHDHSAFPLADSPAAPSAPCGVAAHPEHPAPFVLFTEAHTLRSHDELPLASSLLRSLFRPPRPS